MPFTGPKRPHMDSAEHLWHGSKDLFASLLFLVGRSIQWTNVASCCARAIKCKFFAVSAWMIFCSFAILETKDFPTRRSGLRRHFLRSMEEFKRQMLFGSRKGGPSDVFTYIGLRIRQSHNFEITIDQEDYNKQAHPMCHKGGAPNAGLNAVQLNKYQVLLGVLTWAVINTRPDC